MSCDGHGKTLRVTKFFLISLANVVKKYAPWPDTCCSYKAKEALGSQLRGGDSELLGIRQEGNSQIPCQCDG